MADDNDERRRWVPWSREADEKAKLYSTVAGLFLAILTSGTGYLRVDKFGLSDHFRSVETERLITRAETHREIEDHEEERAVILNNLDKRFDAIERADAISASNAKTCREMLVQQQIRLRTLEKTVHDFQRRK